MPRSGRNVRFQGQMDTTSMSQDTGKYRMKTQTDKFELTEPSVTFTQSAQNTS